MNPVEQIKILNNLVDDINAVLSRHGIDKTITLSDITVTDKTVSDFCKPNAPLSEAITNYLWPSISSEEVYHYTSLQAAEAILNSGTFRLTNIEKRCGEGEIETFCKTHGLSGYLDSTENGVPLFKTLLMPNTYYASFTGSDLTPEREDYLWRTFATHDGVRLKLKITASNPNFRKIQYEAKLSEPIPLISDLFNTVKQKYGRDFILKGISRLCSFYLSGEDYGIENELRALHRTWDGFGPQPVGQGPNSYIELSIGTMSECGYQIDVLEVQSRTKPSMPSYFAFSNRPT
ncbi:hypothetical protein [Stenotrophomonas pigmentata]|uniref:hypothetical protein n=1 Tax=Stenotrophomonas pigmentata TaxID=3055080 RepID=UPI0026F29C48|nr:hypothetical protein [Stenotrophomonas sp. 610A2]